MPEFIAPVLWGVLAYLAGSVNWALVVARLYGVPITTVGTRNPGAANVFREIGRVPGAMVMVLDILTAAAVVLPAAWLPMPDVSRLAAVVMVLLGTFFPIFTGFRGATGLAKAMGVTLGISPIVFFAAIPAGTLVLWRTRKAPLGGGSLIAIVGIFVLVTDETLVNAGIIALASAMVLVRAKFQYGWTIGRRQRQEQ